MCFTVNTRKMVFKGWFDGSWNLSFLLYTFACFLFYKMLTLPSARSKGCCWVTLDICFNCKAPTPFSWLSQVTRQSLIHPSHLVIFDHTNWLETKAVAGKGHGQCLQWHRRWQTKLMLCLMLGGSSQCFWSVVSPQPRPKKFKYASSDRPWVHLFIHCFPVTTPTVWPRLCDNLLTCPLFLAQWFYC